MIFNINLLKYKKNIFIIVKILKNKIDNPSFPAKCGRIFFIEALLYKS